MEINSIEHLASVEVFSNARFEFAASDGLTKPEALVGDFKKNKDEVVVFDLMVALAGLEVTILPSVVAIDSTHIDVEEDCDVGDIADC